MGRRALSLVSWYAAFAWRRLGWEPVAALALLLLAGVLAWQAEELAHEGQVLRTTALVERARKPAPMASEGEVDVSRQLAAFYSQLPGQDALAGQVKQLFTVAAQHGLELEMGDYRAVPDPKAGVLRYQIILPVRGDNDRIQAFVLGAMAELPLLGLEGVSFRRASVASEELQAQVRFFVLARLP